MNGLFADFSGRDEALREVKRYSNYAVMLYRSNLYTHAYRTAALVRAINPYAVKVFGWKYDPVKAEVLALVHDDAEIIFGDVVAGHKYNMTKSQLEAVRTAERLAIKTIAKRFPEIIGRYNYEQLLSEAESHSSLESQVMNYADKYDALGEALHEVYAGNENFVRHQKSEYGVTPTPFEYYSQYFLNFSEKFPKMKPLLCQSHDLFFPVNCSLEYYKNVAKAGKVHTKKSIARPTGDHYYDTWRQAVLACGNRETVESLYIQKEFL